MSIFLDVAIWLQSAKKNVSIRVYPCLSFACLSFWAVSIFSCLSVSIFPLFVSIRVYLFVSIRVYLMCPCLSFLLHETHIKPYNSRQPCVIPCNKNRVYPCLFLLNRVYLFLLTCLTSCLSVSILVRVYLFDNSCLFFAVRVYPCLFSCLFVSIFSDFVSILRSCLSLLVSIFKHIGFYSVWGTQR